MVNKFQYQRLKDQSNQTNFLLFHVLRQNVQKIACTNMGIGSERQGAVPPSPWIFILAFRPQRLLIFNISDLNFRDLTK